MLAFVDRVYNILNIDIENKQIEPLHAAAYVMKEEYKKNIQRKENSLYPKIKRFEKAIVHNLMKDRAYFKS